MKYKMEAVAKLETGRSAPVALVSDVLVGVASVSASAEASDASVRTTVNG